MDTHDGPVLDGADPPAPGHAPLDSRAIQFFIKKAQAARGELALATIDAYLVFAVGIPITWIN